MPGQIKPGTQKTIEYAAVDRSTEYSLQPVIKLFWLRLHKIVNGIYTNQAQLCLEGWADIPQALKRPLRIYGIFGFMVFTIRLFLSNHDIAHD